MAEVPKFGTLAKIHNHYENPYTSSQVYSLYRWAGWVSLMAILSVPVYYLGGRPEVLNVFVGGCLISFSIFLATHIVLKAAFAVR